MVTMEQYSQGYNSKAFMNKTHEYIKDTVNNADQHSLGDQSPGIKY